MNSAGKRSLLVTDFDGTLTRHQYFQLARETLMPPSEPDYWAEYQAGRVTHFEALRAVFASAIGGEPAFAALAARMEPEPDLAAKIDALREAGWDVAVVSAGCGWYIERILAEAGVDAPVFANPGQIVDGHLIMRRPADDADYYSETLGVDKAGLVRWFQESGRTVAFAGDGYPDLEAALATPPRLRFARSELAESLESRGESYRPFDCWGDIVASLVRDSEARK